MRRFVVCTCTKIKNTFLNLEVLKSLPSCFRLTDDSTLAKDAVDGHQDSSAVIANSEAVSILWLLPSTCHPLNKSLTFRPFGMIHSEFPSSRSEFSVAGKVVVSQKAPVGRNLGMFST